MAAINFSMGAKLNRKEARQRLGGEAQVVTRCKYNIKFKLKFGEKKQQHGSFNVIKYPFLSWLVIVIEKKIMAASIKQF